MRPTQYRVHASASAQDVPSGPEAGVTMKCQWSADVEQGSSLAGQRYVPPSPEIRILARPRRHVRRSEHLDAATV